MFGFDYGPHVNVVDGLEERMRLLKQVNASDNGYQLVLPIGAEIGTNYVSSHNKFLIRQKNFFLLNICQKAVDELNNDGFEAAANFQVVAKWNRVFRVNEKFPHPNPNVRMGKKPKPMLFEVFPNLEARVHEFVIKNLSHLSVEMVSETLIKVLIPNLMKELVDDNETGTVAYDLLTEYVTHPPTYNMVLRWMLSMTRKIGRASCHRQSCL